MALLHLNYFNPALLHQHQVDVLLPDEPPPPAGYPVLYLLHGFTDGYTAWQRKSSLERHMQGWPFLIVLPDGANSFYIDTAHGQKYDTAITHDLIGLIDSTFRTDPRRAARAVAGLSMGGYGALKLAFAHPDLFVSAASLSGALGWAHTVPEMPDWAAYIRLLAGDNHVGGPHDLFACAERADHTTLPSFWIDCGTEDGLIGQNRDFHAHLTAVGIEHEYHEFPGAHTWIYWDQHIVDVLAFHGQVMGITRKEPRWT